MRKVARDEASFASGLPVTTPERTIFDLVADEEDLSLVADALHGACAGSRPFDFNKLEALIHGKYGKNKANQILTSLLSRRGDSRKGLTHGVQIRCSIGDGSQGGLGTRRQAIQPRLESAVQRIAMEPRRLELEIGASSLRLPSDDDGPDFARLPYR